MAAAKDAGPVRAERREYHGRTVVDLAYDDEWQAPPGVPHAVELRMMDAESQPLGRAVLRLLEENAALRRRVEELERRGGRRREG